MGTEVSEENITATAGLRRLVLHARDRLRSSTIHPPHFGPCRPVAPGQQRNAARAEVDAAVEAQEQAESIEAETFERWERAVELARTDAAAAIRYLLDGERAQTSADEAAP